MGSFAFCAQCLCMHVVLQGVEASLVSQSSVTKRINLVKQIESMTCIIMCLWAVLVMDLFTYVLKVRAQWLTQGYRL